MWTAEQQVMARHESIMTIGFSVDTEFAFRVSAFIMMKGCHIGFY